MRRLHDQATELADAALRAGLGDEEVLTVARRALLRARAQGSDPASRPASPAS